MKKMFVMIVATMIALTLASCSDTAHGTPALDTIAPVTTATATDTEAEVTAAPADNGIANDLETHATVLATDTKTITLATTKLGPSAEMLVAAYQEGNWNGSFVEEAGHCFSIDNYGKLWIDCEDLWVFPDLPSGEKNVADDIIGKNSEGTWVFHQNFKADEFRFQLWHSGNLVAQSELVEFATYESVVSSENGLTCRSFNGEIYTLMVVRDNLIVMADSMELPAHNSAPKSFEEEKTELLSKLQKLYWAGTWKGEFQFIDGHYVKVDENCRSWWNIDNVSYDVNLNVPVTGTNWSDPNLDWAIIDGVAVRFSKGEVKAILPLPEATLAILEDCCNGITVKDAEANLWHVKDGKNILIAENVVDAICVNHIALYLGEDGNAYLYEDGATELFAEEATEVGLYGDYGWGAVVPEEESNVNYHGKHLWVADNIIG